jgi:hypothetical protein
MTKFRTDKEMEELLAVEDRELRTSEGELLRLRLFTVTWKKYDAVLAQSRTGLTVEQLVEIARAEAARSDMPFDAMFAGTVHMLHKAITDELLPQ